jgi:phage shock protein A
MSIMARLKRVTVGRMEAFLASVEDPETVFPQLVREMEEQVRLATDCEAKAMAAVKAAERTRDQASAKLDKMTEGARAALLQGDETTAREAIAVQIQLEDDVARCAAAVATANQSYSDAHSARVQTQKQLDEVRAKKNEILTRARVVQSQEKIQRTVQGPAASTGSILDAVSRMEAQLDEKEAALSVRKELGQSGGGGTVTLEQRIENLHKQSEVERRLEAMKTKAA